MTGIGWRGDRPPAMEKCDHGIGVIRVRSVFHRRDLGWLLLRACHPAQEACPRTTLELCNGTPTQ